MHLINPSATRQFLSARLEDDGASPGEVETGGTLAQRRGEPNKPLQTMTVMLAASLTFCRQGSLNQTTNQTLNVVLAVGMTSVKRVFRCDCSIQTA